MELTANYIVPWLSTQDAGVPSMQQGINVLTALIIFNAVLEAYVVLYSNNK